MTGMLSQVKQGVLGNDAGWALAFHRENDSGHERLPFLTIDCSQYYASIDATLPEGLSPGAYKIVVEQLTDVHAAALRTPAGKKPVVAKLYLFWRDANTSAGAYFTNLIGLNAAPPLDENTLVAQLRLNKIARRAGQRGYDAELTLVESVYARLRQRVPGPDRLAADDFTLALHQILQRTHVIGVIHTASDGSLTKSTGQAAGSESVSFGVGMRYTDAVDSIANAIQQSLNQYGRGMVLIRDGTLHVGPRPIPFPFPSGAVKDLTLATGLLVSEETGEVETDPYGDAESSAGVPRKRALWTFTCKGRPDIKPGDVVRFEPPPEDEAALPGLGVAIAGAFAAPLLPSMGELTGLALLAYVRSVRHTQSRTAGFTTMVQGVVIASADTAWDAWRDATPTAPPAPTGSATPGVQAAEAMRRVARASRLETRVLEVGEVRATTTDASGAVEPPAQTQTVWEGLVRGDGRPNGVRRLPIRTETPTPVTGVAYLTPFAWGGCGLVVPRYPGTRVALGYRNGTADDPVQLGALWPSGRAPVSEPGDWWLSLPVEVEKKASFADSDTAKDHSGKVVHDLTDGDGNRVIELGELTVRVGRSKLKGKGQRPKRAGDEDSITIEHAGGDAKLVIKQDGTILIKGKKIELDAGTGDISMKAKKIELDAGTGDISMKAKKVDVTVGEAMDVHG